MCGCCRPAASSNLPLEALAAEGGSELRVQELERDGTFVLEVAGQVDRGHAAATELALDYVPACQGGPQPLQ